MKSYRSRRRYLSLAAFAAVALPASMGATTILYSNLASPNSASFSAVSSTSWAANSFSTDSNSYNLADVILSLEGVSTTGTLTVSLYSSSSGKPGTDLMTLGTIADSALSTSSFTQQTVSGNNFSLSPSTMYYIVLSGSTAGSPDADWERENGSTGTGVAGQSFGLSADSGTSWTTHVVNSDFQPYVMQVDAGSGTPEPSTLLGALGGLAAILGLRLRRRVS